LLLRLYTYELRADIEQEFVTFIREHSIDYVRRQPGVVAAWFGRREVGAGGDYVAVTCWRDFETMRSAIGSDLERPIFAPPGREMDVAGSARHFETIDEPAVGSGTGGTTLRLLRGRITPGREEEVYASIRREGWPLLDRLSGLVDARIGRQASRDGDVILHVTIWEDRDALRKGTGGKLQRPLMPMPPDSFTVESIDHYDIIESSIAPVEVPG
jgi:heme-degrading monooxygenase HmoA